MAKLILIASGLVLSSLALAQEVKPSQVECPNVNSVTIRQMGGGTYKWQTQYQWGPTIATSVYGGGGAKALKLLPKAGVKKSDGSPFSQIWCVYESESYEKLGDFDSPILLKNNEGILIAHVLNGKCTIAPDKMSFYCKEDK